MNSLERYLKGLTHTQVVRLAFNVWARMTRDDGYQPYGYDWPTLWMTSPKWMGVYTSILAEHKERKANDSQISS